MSDFPELSNYATKSDLKNTTGIDTSGFAKEDDLAKLKPAVDELDIDKLKNEASGLNSLKSKVHKLDLDKVKNVLVDLKKLIDIAKKEFVKKDVYNKLVKKFNAIQTSDTSDLVKNTDCNTNINETGKKINVLRYDYKYTNTEECNRLTAANFSARLKQANLVSKSDLVDFVKKILMQR